MSDESCFHNLREGGIVRQLAADSRCVVLDIFAPPREEYRQAGSGLGSATLAR